MIPNSLSMVALFFAAWAGSTAAAPPNPAQPLPALSPAAERQLIAQATGGRFSARRGETLNKDCNQKVPYTAEVVDLNRDGQPEVLTSEFGSCVGGRVGSTMDLYVRDKQGRWRAQFGFPGIFMPQATRHGGWPDVGVGGPGTCMPVWRWNGQRYDIHKRCGV